MQPAQAELGRSTPRREMDAILLMLAINKAEPHCHKSIIWGMAEARGWSTLAERPKTCQDLLPSRNGSPYTSPWV